MRGLEGPPACEFACRIAGAASGHGYNEPSASASILSHTTPEKLPIGEEPIAFADIEDAPPLFTLLENFHGASHLHSTNTSLGGDERPHTEQNAFLKNDRPEVRSLHFSRMGKVFFQEGNERRQTSKTIKERQQKGKPI